MTIKEQFESIQLDTELLQKSSNNIAKRLYKQKLVTDELLKYLYIDCNYSAFYIYTYLKNIHKSLAWSAGHIIKKLRNMGIETRDHSNAAMATHTIELKKESNLLNSGYTHPSKNPLIKERKRQQCLTKYGVDNNFKSDIIKDKMKEFYRRNYGVDYNFEIPGFQQNCKGFYISRPHKRVNNILLKHGILFQVEKNLICRGYNKVLGKQYNPRVDILIEHLNLVIEVNGDYWHANPKLYKPNDLFNTVYGPMTAQELWIKDKIKAEHIKSFGYNFEVIWESDINEGNILQLIKQYENSKNK